MIKLKQRTLFRHFLWALGLLSPKTQTTLSERQCLIRHAAGRQRLVEIGVFNGVTTLELRKAMPATATLWAVDPFIAGRLGYNLDERIARHVINQSSNGTVEMIKLISAAAMEKYKALKLPPVEFLFVDGDHTWAGIDADWKGWAPLIGVGGIVALHDSRSYPGREVTLDSARYTKEVICADPRFEVIDEVDSITVLRAGH